MRGGLHVYAYALAQEKLTGVDVKKLMSIPTLSNARFPEARAFMKHGLHWELYTFSPNADMEAGVIWNGKHPEDGSELQVIPGAKKGGPYPVLEEGPQLNSPGEDNFDPEMFADIAKKLGLSKTCMPTGPSKVRGFFTGAAGSAQVQGRAYFVP